MLQGPRQNGRERRRLPTFTDTRSIRPTPLACNSSLLAGPDSGTRQWVTIVSLMRTAKFNGVEPFADLTSILTKVVAQRLPADQLERTSRATRPLAATDGDDGR